MEAMELAAGQAWKEAGAVGGSLESDSFHDGVRLALVEFLRNRHPPRSLDGSSPFGRGRKQAWAILSAMTLGVGIGLDVPPVVLPELSEQDRHFAPGWILRRTAQQRVEKASLMRVTPSDSRGASQRESVE